jgi:hypothetical protein
MEEIFLCYTIYFANGFTAMANGTVMYDTRIPITMENIMEFQRELQARATTKENPVDNVLVMFFQSMDLRGHRCQSNS